MLFPSTPPIQTVAKNRGIYPLVPFPPLLKQIVLSFLYQYHRHCTGDCTTRTWSLSALLALLAWSPLPGPQAGGGGRTTMLSTASLTRAGWLGWLGGRDSTTK